MSLSNNIDTLCSSNSILMYSHTEEEKVIPSSMADY